MRKLILIAAMSLLATEVHAGGPRGLSLAASGTSQQAEPPATTPQTTQAPPAPQSTNVQTAATAPTSAATATTAPAASTAPVAAAPASTSPARPAATREATKTEIAKPKRRQSSTEARVIRELHRHGIYW
ncbi:hypothetical protein [Bradyrhizobium liaoningense]